MAKLVPENTDLSETAFHIDTHSSQKVNDTDIPDLPPADSEPKAKIEAREDRRSPSSESKGDADKEPSSRFQERFSEVYGTAKRLERDVEYERERAERLEKLLEQQLTSGAKPKENVPEKWRKILGDTPVTEEFYQALKEEFGTSPSLTKEEILETIREEQRAEARGQRAVEESIDSERDALEDRIGKDLTDDEATEILEIAYELTPKDRHGNYDKLVPMSAAYGEYRARQLETKTPQRTARTQAAAVIGARSGNIQDTPRPTSGGRPDPGAWRSIFRQ